MTATNQFCESTFETALRYHAAGISTIPIRLDGSKSPAIKRWTPFQKHLPTLGQLRGWFDRQDHAIGIVCGVVSQGLEVLDFDDGSLLEPWRQSVADIANALTFISTPSGGWHVLYRCCEISGNSKIANDPNREKKTLIETRGEGGYIVGVGSPASAHPANKPYEHVAGLHPWRPWEITPGERRELWKAARAFTKDLEEVEKIRKKFLPKSQRSPSTIPNGRHRVIQDFIDRHSCGEILERNGWNGSDGEHWTRPGKTSGVSAHVLIADDGTEVVINFSSNTPLPTNTPINVFELFRHLEHNGDSKQAFASARRETVLA